MSYECRCNESGHKWQHYAASSNAVIHHFKACEWCDEIVPLGWGGYSQRKIKDNS